MQNSAELERDLAERGFCDECPIAHWRREAAKAGLNMYMGNEWSAPKNGYVIGYAIWLYPNNRQREAKDIVWRGASLNHLCVCKADKPVRQRSLPLGCADEYGEEITRHGKD